METRLKVQLISAIGLSVDTSQSKNHVLRDMAQGWVYVAQAWLAGPMEKDLLTIGRIQIYCLTLLAREVLSIGSDLVWLSVGSLVHEAMQIGLHRDPKYLPDMGFMKAEIRRRLWYTIVEMLVQFSLDAALPPRLSMSDFDTRLPGNFHDVELEESVPVPPHPALMFTSTSVQLALLETLPQRLEIVHLLTALDTNVPQSKIETMSSFLLEACGRNYNFLKSRTGNGANVFQLNLVDMLVRRFLLPLLWPLAKEGRRAYENGYYLKLSLDAAMALLSPAPDASYGQLITNAGGSFREGIRCAGTMIGIEFIAEIQSRRRDGTLHRTQGLKDVLRQYLEKLLDVSADRIQQGETNVKMHTFIAMILAYGKAMEMNVPSDIKVADAAKESLEFCLNLLEARAPSSTGQATSGPFLDSQFEGLDFDLDFFFTDSPF
jgi:hypothetical protein